jgi:pimeloyl-ACP methyl ester carboxylesterase
MAAQVSQLRAARSLGLVRLIGASQWGAPGMATETRAEMALFASGERMLAATTAEGLDRAADDAQLQAAPALRDLPLIVLAAGQNMAQMPNWPEAQRRQAALSTNGRLIVAESSGHYIHWEQPALVIDAVRQVIEKARSR